jgi:hypothetical protein
MARSGSQSAEAVDLGARYGYGFAAVAFVLAYVILLTDPKARAEMFPWVVSTGACLGAIVWDERRLRADRLACAFPSSRTLHVLAFGPIAVVLHFLRTRWPTPPRPRVGFIGWLRELGQALRSITFRSVVRGLVGRAIAIGVAALAAVAVTIPQIAVGMMMGGAGDSDDDIGDTIIAFVLALILLVVIWRFLLLLDRWFALEVGLVLVGLILIFGSSVGIGLVFHVSPLATIVGLSILVTTMVRALVAKP